MRLLPQTAPPGPFRRASWRSPLRGPWLTSVLGAALLAGIPIVVLTGLLSYVAYERATTLLQDVYLRRWLAISGALFAASALLYAVRARRRG